LSQLQAEKDAGLAALGTALTRFAAEQVALEPLEVRLTHARQKLGAAEVVYAAALSSGKETGSALQMMADRILVNRVQRDEAEGRFRAQEQKVRECAKAVEGCRSALDAASKKLEVEQDKKKDWKAALKREQLRQEQKELDEMSTMRFRKPSSETR